MTIPRPALMLSFALLIPMVWGAVTVIFPELGLWVADAIGGRFVGPYIQLMWGQVMLAFMAGMLWAFATRADGQVAATGLGLSIIPMVWAFVMVGGGPVSAAMNLIFGYLGLLALDLLFARQGLAPPWWMPLRGPVVAVIIACLIVTVI